MKDEIVIYQPDKKSSRLEVRIENETVWLTQTQMVALFDSTKQNISLHINNIFREREVAPESTVKEYLTVQYEGLRTIKRTQISELFNRDVKTIGKHINNALNEELCGFQVVAKFATTAFGSKDIFMKGLNYFLLRIRCFFGFYIIPQFNNTFVIK
jgi:hypothetical protein